MLNSYPRRPLVTLRLRRIRIGNSGIEHWSDPLPCLSTSFVKGSDQCSILNAQFLPEKTARHYVVPSDKNWEFGIKHWSDRLPVPLSLCDSLPISVPLEFGQNDYS